MVKYDDMAAMVFAKGSISDGFNGERAQVGFAWHNSQTYVVSYCGYFNSSMPNADSQEDALFNLRYHHRAKLLGIQLQEDN